MNMHEIDLAVGFYWFLLDSIGFLLVLSVLFSIGHIGFYWSIGLYQSSLVLSVLLVLLVSIGPIGSYWSYWFILVLLVSIGRIDLYWSYWFLLVLLVSIYIGFYGCYWFLLVSDGLNGLYWIQFYGSNRNQQTPTETIRDQQNLSNGLYWSLWIFDLGINAPSWYCSPH